MPRYKRSRWPERPQSLTERSYRKLMAKQKTYTINGQEYRLQSVSPTWYMEQNDKYGMTGGGKKETAQYMDAMFRNVVISPPEVASRGISFFDDNDDIKSAVALLKAIEAFFLE